MRPHRFHFIQHFKNPAAITSRYTKLQKVNSMKKSLNTLLLGSTIGLASLSTLSAFAQTPAAPAPAAAASSARGQGLGKPARPSFKSMDTNHDKMLSRDEVKGRPMLEKNFDAIDINKDGQITRAEMKAYREAHKGERKQ